MAVHAHFNGRRSLGIASFLNVASQCVDHLVSADRRFLHMLYRFASEMLSEFVEDLSNVKSFALRSKSALFFKSLLSLCSELARRLGLHA